MSRRDVTSREGRTLVLSLLAVCLLVLLVPVRAWASVSSAMSDDGQDYGCLYRKGDCLLRIDAPDENVLSWSPYYRRWYYSSEYNPNLYFATPYDARETYYLDGTVYYHAGDQVYLPAIMSGNTFARHYTWSTPVPLYNQYDESYPRIRVTRYQYGQRCASVSEIRRVVFDEDVLPGFKRSSSNRYLDRWFEGCYNLMSIEGFQYVPTQYVLSMARMFAGCSSLGELDLSTFDTAQCSDFGGMFEGCSSLYRLTLGEQWTQEAARQAIMAERAQEMGTDSESAEPSGGAASDEGAYGESGDETPSGETLPDEVPPGETPLGEVDDPQTDGPSPGDGFALSRDGELVDERLATFPVAMSCVRDGEVVAYQAGDVIPDGPGTYEVMDRTPLRLLRYTMTGSDGSVWTSDGENADRHLLTCDYASEGARPAVTVEDQGSILVEGVDYTLSYDNNLDEGYALVTVTALGDTYFGACSLPFIVEDTSAYAFLYEDGLLYLKAAHDMPSTTAVSATKVLMRGPLRWYDARMKDAGSTVPWKEEASQVTRVVIDPSFVSCAPKTTAGWFAGCTHLTTIEGLSNIDGSCLVSMRGMFEDCVSLGELDLSGLKTSHASDFGNLVAGCSSLERLVLGDLDLTNAKTTAGFFDGCTSLREVSTAYGWQNAALATARLALPKEAFRTDGNGARLAAKTAVPDGAGTYWMGGISLRTCAVSTEKASYTCTGKPIKPRVIVRLGSLTLKEGVDYSVSFENNIYPGDVTPKATVTGRGVFSGGLVVPFKIVSRVTKVGDRLIIKNKTGTFVVEVTKVSKNGKAAQVAVVSVDAAPSIKGMTLPSECTIGNVKVTVTAVSSKLKGNFRNVTSVVIGAKVTTIGSRAFARATKVKTLIIKSARLKSVKSCLSGSKITKVHTKVSLSSTKRRTYKRWFTSSSTVGKRVTYSYASGRSVGGSS